MPIRHNQNVVWSKFLDRENAFLTRARFTEQPFKCWKIEPDPRPVDELIALTQLLSGRRLEASGNLEPLNPRSLQQTWTVLKTKVSR